MSGSVKTNCWAGLACRACPGPGRSKNFSPRCAATRRTWAAGFASCCRATWVRSPCSTTFPRRKCARRWNTSPSNGKVSPMSIDFPAETRALLTLHLVPGLGPRLTAALLRRFGSAEGALRASADQLREVPYLGAKLADELAEAIGRVNVESELEQLSKHAVWLLALGSPEYPASLSQIADPPHLLY